MCIEQNAVCARDPAHTNVILQFSLLCAIIFNFSAVELCTQITSVYLIEFIVILSGCLKIHLFNPKYAMLFLCVFHYIAQAAALPGNEWTRQKQNDIENEKNKLIVSIILVGTHVVWTVFHVVQCRNLAFCLLSVQFFSASAVCSLSMCVFPHFSHSDTLYFVSHKTLHTHKSTCNAKI